MQDLSSSPRTKKKMIRSCNTNDRGTLENVDEFKGSELQHMPFYLPITLLKRRVKCFSCLNNLFIATVVAIRSHGLRGLC